MFDGILHRTKEIPFLVGYDLIGNCRGRTVCRSEKPSPLKERADLIEGIVEDKG